MGMSFVALDSLTCRVIKDELAERGLPLSVRVELRSTGCCDASLGIAAASVEAGDLIAEFEGLQIVMTPALHDLVGGVSISQVNDCGQQGFIVRSEKSLNEWTGFAANCIRL